MTFFKQEKYPNFGLICGTKSHFDRSFCHSGEMTFRTRKKHPTFGLDCGTKSRFATVAK
jgi:hypothetical protein